MLSSELEFIEQMGFIVQRDGLPRIAGRILGFLIINGGEYSFAQLSEELKISRASVSTNTRLLESLSIIERTAILGERQHYYRLKNKPFVALLKNVRQNMTNSKLIVNETIKNIDNESAKSRLKELQDFYTSFLSATSSIVKE